MNVLRKVLVLLVILGLMSMGTVFAQSPTSPKATAVEKARAALLERMKTNPISSSVVDPETLTGALPNEGGKPSIAAPTNGLPKTEANLSAFKPDSAGKITVIVDLASLPIAEQLIRGGVVTQALGPVVDTNSIRTALETEHATVLSRLAGINFEMEHEYFTAYNGFAISIDQADLKTVQELFGMSAVHPTRTYYADLQASVPLCGGTWVWTNLGFKGEGQVIGIVDTGVDYNHPDLGGGFGNKVINMIDVAEHTGDAMDYNGHGTHVSGAMAAKAASATGVNGMAPEAKLMQAKIVHGAENSATSEDIAAAFDWMLAIKFSGVNLVSVNMSFGSSGGFNDVTDPEQIAIQNCINNGIFVSLSAGNSYYSVYPYNQVTWYGEDPNKLSYYPADISIVGAPSVVPGAISVAASWNAASRNFSFLINDGSSTRGAYASAAVDPIARFGATPQSFVYIGYGNDDTYYAGKDVTGKIALILRGGPGDANFVNKLARAKAHGAAGVLVMNDAARGDAMLSMATPSGYDIPALFIGYTAGTYLVNHPAAQIVFDGQSVSTPNPLVDQMVDFSSWGTDPNLNFKPEITKPGGGIWSTYPIALGSYANLSGTSMSSPQVNGAAALIKQAHPTWIPAQIKVALMNTAKVLIEPTKNLPYSTRLQGAGRVQVDKAITTPVWVTENTTGKAGIALGDLNSLTSTTFTLKAENTSSSAVTYNLSGTIQRYNASRLPFNLAGGKITFSPTSVIVPALGSVTFQVTVDLSGNTAYENIFVDGFVYLTPTDARLPVLHVPYTLFWGDWQDNRYTADWIHNPVIDPPPDDPSGWSWYGYTWMYDARGSDLNYLGQDFYGNFDRNAIAISPNGDGIQDNAHPLVSFMRGTPNFAYQILNSDGSLLTTAAVDSFVPKNYNDHQYWSGWNNDWIWQPTPGTVPDGSYTARLKAEIPGTFVVGSGQFETVDFPLIVDTVNPIVDSFTVTPSADGWDLHWTASDDRSGLWGYMIVLDGDFANPIYVGSDVDSQYVSGNLSVMLFAIDNAGNMGVGVSGIPAPLNLSLYLEAGWNLLTYPLVYMDNLPDQLFGDFVGSWTVITWDPVSGHYHGKADSVLDPGVGFWLKLTVPQTYAPIGAPAASSRVQLFRGSNLIGVPLMKNVYWNDVWVIPSQGAPMTMENAVSAGLVRGIALGWNGMQYYDVKHTPGYFEALLGYWMWATVPLQLDFNYLPIGP